MAEHSRKGSFTWTQCFFNYLDILVRAWHYACGFVLQHIRMWQDTACPYGFPFMRVWIPFYQRQQSSLSFPRHTAKLELQFCSFTIYLNLNLYFIIFLTINNIYHKTFIRKSLIPRTGWATVKIKVRFYVEGFIKLS